LASRRKHRRREAADGANATVDLNLMPFIDIFSLLTTFLLFSAVFVHIGILEVQIPFLTNAPPPESKSTRTISVKADISDQKLEITSEWSEPPIDQQKYEFDHTDSGIASMHQKLLEVRQSSPDNDKITLFVDDEITYERMTKVLDAIKMLNPGEPRFKPIADAKDPDDPDSGKKLGPEEQADLYPKVVMGSVML
jgi:biopolymer transport protein ExbD